MKKVARNVRREATTAAPMAIPATVPSGRRLLEAVVDGEALGTLVVDVGATPEVVIKEANNDNVVVVAVLYSLRVVNIIFVGP